MLKRSALVLSAVATAILASACTSDEGGTPLATGTGDATSSSSNEAPETSSSDPGGSAVADLDPCTLLSTSELADYGNLEGPKDPGFQSVRACDWQTPVGADEGLVIGVAVRDDAGVRDANDTGSGIDFTEVDGREVARIPDAGGHCIIALGVTDSSRVDVNVTAPDTQRACEIADEVAGIVEPKLPEG